jgi:PmbA protein
MAPARRELLDVGDEVVGWARDGEQVEVVVAYSKDTEVRVYEGEVESFSSAESQGVGIRVITGVEGDERRQGFAYAGTLDQDVLRETLDDARDNAGFGTVDALLGLAEPDGVSVPELDLWNDEVGRVPTADKVALATELEAAVRGADARISGVESAEFVDSIGEAAVVTTTGIRSAGREVACYLAAYALASEGDDTQTGFGYSVGRRLSELDVGKAAQEAADRATRLLGATKPGSQRTTVVLDPFVTAQLLGIVGSTLSGEAVLKGRSLFADRVGDPVGSGLLTLVDDPTDPRAFTAGETDGEGLACRRNVLIQDGVLQGFVHNTYTGRALGTQSTGSAVRGFKSTPGAGCQAVSLLPGVKDQEQLVAEVGEGILVQGVSGLHSGVNPVSGDFSTGAEGLRIVGGSVGEPLREFTIASTLQRMLLDVAAVGSDLEWFPMSANGVSLVIHDVTVSGA